MSDDAIQRNRQDMQRKVDQIRTDADLNHEAAERGVRRVADAYLRERPEEGRRWERYAEARTKAELPAALDAFPPPKPPEL